MLILELLRSVYNDLSSWLNLMHACFHVYVTIFHTCSSAVNEIESKVISLFSVPPTKIGGLKRSKSIDQINKYVCIQVLYCCAKTIKNTSTCRTIAFTIGCTWALKLILTWYSPAAINTSKRTKSAAENSPPQSDESLFLKKMTQYFCELLKVLRLRLERTGPGAERHGPAGGVGMYWELN